MAKLGKRIKAIYAKNDQDKIYNLDDALAFIQENASAKFDETCEIALKLGVDPKHSDQMVRGVVNLPHGTGKDIKIAVFAKGDKADQAKAAGADIVGDEDLVAKIQKGDIAFDRCIATPDLMPLVGKVAKILGPKGLMPNPKLGTVTPDVEKAVKDAKSGQVEFRVEKNGIIHAGLGKTSFKKDQLKANVLAFVDAISQAKPSGAKGKYFISASMSSTMGAGLKVEINDLTQAA